MAACSLFEEDEVCHVTPDNTYVYGLVMQNSETVSSDEEDSRHDVCKKGCVRVAWHPKGKESLDTPENKVLLADRSLIVADIVRRFVPGQETQCGSVQDLQVTCHLHITGTDKYIYNIDSKQLSSCVQLQRFDNGYVTMDNWLGRVDEVAETITLLLPDGAKCEVDDSDVCYLDDISEKRPETATYNEEYWYPGQQLRGLLGNLCNAKWLSTSLMYNPKNVETKRNCTLYAVVEKVQIRSIFVYWICRGYSKASISSGNKLSPPPREVKGPDIERLQLVDWFEHCTVKLGDKMYYTIREEDVLETQLPKHRCAPYAVQHASAQRLAEVTHRTEDLYHQRFDESNKPRRRGNRKGGVSSVSASSSNSTATTTVASSISASSVTMTEALTAVTASAVVGQETVTASSQTPVDKGAGDPEAGTDADDEYEDVDEGKGDDSGSDDGSVSSSASGAKRRKRDKGVGMSIKSLRNASRHAKRARPVAEIKVTPGSRVATEVCYTFSLVTVMWQDGSVEDKIPSVDLFPVHHMDELEFFPGSFVIDAAAADTSSEYGVVTSCNHFERTCQVRWLKPYELGQTNAPTDVIKESEVSVYDIHDHPDYKFRPGHSVIRVAGFEDTQQTLQAVGQVIRTDPTGTILVHWSDGSFTSCYPQDLYIVWDMSDYSNSSWESEESSSSEEESESDASWETEEEEEGWKVDAGGEGTQSEEEEWDSLKGMNEKRRSEIESLMSRIQNFFGVMNDFYVALTLSPDAAHNSTTMDTTMISCLKRVLKMYRSCRKLDKTLKTAYFSTPEVLNLVASIKYDMKKERTNKIKQHLEHIFESSNKGLLDKSRGDLQKMEVATSTIDLDGSRVDEMRLDSVAATATASSPSKRIKTEDVGTSVDVELGSSVDSLCSPSKACVVSNGVPLSTQDVERDISSRLAAANVDENTDTAAAASPPSEGRKLVEKEGKASGDETCVDTDQTLEKCEESSAVDGDAAHVAKVVQLCEIVQETLASIQENLDKIYEAMKGSRRNSASSANKVGDAPEEVKSEQNKENQNGCESPKPLPCPASGAGKEGDVDGGLPPDTDVDMRADNQEACDTPSSCSPGSNQLNSKEEEEGDIVDPPGVVLPTGFFMCDRAPECHSYIAKTCHPSNPKAFNAAIRREVKLLRSSLPDGIIVKGFDDRMDLFSVLIDGPSNTPYEDGMFVFDIMLPHDYPTNPPLFHYLSFCSDRLNPNLYADGKVCVSLLGTWSGKGMEVWTQKSNLLQVLVSIQGLILVDEPYYNEAGYEKQRGQQIALENSRVYNEMALLKLVESMTAMCGDLPRPFEQEVQERLQNNGPRMIERLRKWLSLSESMGDRQRLLNAGKAVACTGGGTAAEPVTYSSEQTKDDTATSSGAESAAEPDAACCQPQRREPVPEGHPHYPLLPMSKGFRLTLRKSLTHLEAALHKLKTGEGPENGAQSNHAAPAPPQSDRLELASS